MINVKYEVNGQKAREGCKRRLYHMWKTREVLCAAIIKFKSESPLPTY